jgi:hypothetical protein
MVRREGGRWGEGLPPPSSLRLVLLLLFPFLSFSLSLSLSISLSLPLGTGTFNFVGRFVALHGLSLLRPVQNPTPKRCGVSTPTLDNNCPSCDNEGGALCASESYNVGECVEVRGLY